jgi:hypothetical protein
MKTISSTGTTKTSRRCCRFSIDGITSVKNVFGADRFGRGTCGFGFDRGVLATIAGLTVAASFKGPLEASRRLAPGTMGIMIVSSARGHELSERDPLLFFPVFGGSLGLARITSV